VDAPVTLPTGLVLLRALRALFAVAHNRDPLDGDTQLLDVVLGRFGAAIAQSQVVFRAAAFVAMTLDHDGCVREVVEDCLERAGVPGKNIAGAGADIRLVIIEEGVLDFG